MSRALRVRVAFEIIVQHFSCQTLDNSQTEIYELVRKRYDSVNAYVGLVPERDHVKKALTYLNHFGLVEKCRPRPCWHIKSVEEMCQQLRNLDDNSYIRVSESNHPISLAFGIIIHHFNDQTVPTTEIETRIETEIKNYPGELSQYQNVVPHTLRFLSYFGFAKKLEDGDWHIKSVDDMCDRLRDMGFIDGKYKLSDEDKIEVFYLFNAEESCNFTTKEYYYTEFWDLNEKFCQECYSEIEEEIKTYSDEHQNRLMQSLAKKQKDAFKDRNFHAIFRHKYCNHEYCDKCNEKIVLKQDYVLVNPNYKEHLFSVIKQNYLICSCSDFIYLPVVEKDVFLEQSQTSEDNTEKYILSLDSIKKGYSLLENHLYHDANTKIIRVNKIDIENRIWFLSDYIPMKCKEKHSQLGKSVCDKVGNMIKGYYEIWVELNRSCRILDGLLPKIFPFRFMGDPLTQNVVSNIEAIYNENPMFWADYTKRIYKDIVIGICNLIDKDTEHNTISFFFLVNDEDLKKTDIGKKIANLLKTLYDNNLNDYSRLIKLRNKLFAHIDLDYLPTQNADELFLELQNLLIDIPLIKKFLEVISQIFESISEYYELRIDFKLNEITTTMHSDPLIRDINNILYKLDVYPLIKNTAHEKIEFHITKEVIEKCQKEKKELDTVKNIVKNYAVSDKGEIYFIDDKNEIGLDNDQLNVLIRKHVRTWIKDDDGISPIYSDDPEVNNPLIVSLNNSPILEESLNAHMLLFKYSNRDMRRDTGIIQELRNVGQPAYTITEELIQWIEDFYADKKVSPITCFIEHQGVDKFTGVNASNGIVGIAE